MLLGNQAERRSSQVEKQHLGVYLYVIPLTRNYSV